MLNLDTQHLGEKLGLAGLTCCNLYAGEMEMGGSPGSCYLVTLTKLGSSRLNEKTYLKKQVENSDFHNHMDT